MGESCKIGADPPDLNKFSNYEDFKNNVLLWEGFTDYKKARMGAMLAYSIPNESITFGDHIQKDLFKGLLMFIPKFYSRSLPLSTYLNE